MQFFNIYVSSRNGSVLFAYIAFKTETSRELTASLVLNNRDLSREENTSRTL